MGNQASNKPNNKPKLKPKLKPKPLSRSTRQLSVSGPSSARPDSMTRTGSMPRTPSIYPQMTSRVSKTHVSQFLDLNIDNGVTGPLVSTRVCAMIYTFWTNHISALSQAKKLEVASSIFWVMISTSKSVKRMVFRMCKKEYNNMLAKEIEKLSVRFLDMMGWIVRSLMRDDIDLFASLKTLGQQHRHWNITLDMFDPMLQAMHETFEYYFERGYSFEVRYAMDEIFILISNIMMGQRPNPYQNKSHLKDINATMHKENVQFLQSLHVCLESSVGKDYFIRYLKQTWCHEIAIWLESILRFKNATNDKQRFFIARNINKVSIQSSSVFAINISYGARQGALQRMTTMEERFATKQALNIDSDLFTKVEHEMIELMRKNHWVNFVNDVKKLKSRFE
eukprot:489414_1